MSSLSGLRGTPYISAYAASKAWAMILAEGVGRETAGEGVDILACVAGATDTPGYRDSLTGRSVAPVQSPTAVAREALAVLGRRNLLITGRMNRLIARFVYGLMPREWGSRILTKAAGSLRRRDDAGLGYSSGAEIRIRRSESIDLPFMREMLYEAVYWRSIGEGTNPPPEEGLSVPAVAAGLENWGRRPGDTAVIALLESKPVGAAWYRFYTGDHSIRGYIADNVPVLAMAVHRDHRRAGIGETLISGLMTEASKQKVSRISLMVSNDNTAGRLYEKCGFTCYEEVGDSMLMIRDIPD